MLQTPASHNRLHDMEVMTQHMAELVVLATQNPDSWRLWTAMANQTGLLREYHREIQASQVAKN